MDDISYLGANGDLTGYKLFAYCSNNPVDEKYFLSVDKGVEGHVKCFDKIRNWFLEDDSLCI